jgi:hypothetical protein
MGWDAYIGSRLWIEGMLGISKQNAFSASGVRMVAAEIAKGEPLRRFSAQHIELVVQRRNLRLERGL